MNRITRARTTVRRGLAVLLSAAMGGPATGQHDEVLRALNRDDTVQGTEQSKSYRVLFDAYIELDPPPFEVGDDFSLNTIHPQMRDWAVVSGWAESNPKMAEAILACKDRNIIGLPYGVDEVESNYREAGLVTTVGVGGSLRQIDFRYLEAVDAIAAFATAEIYRRLEAGQSKEGLQLAVAFNWVLRQLCDRQFLVEKRHSIQLLIDALANLRDMFYKYQDAIPGEQFVDLAWYDIPELRPDRNRLHIPEGDRVVSEALLEEVFGEDSQADPDKFAAAFASIQAVASPLTRFGAARRWRNIAAVHGSLEASKERLELIYDDWWRRWRVQEYDAILETDSQFDRTNPIRYAAVIYSMQNIEAVFTIRNQLIAAVNGTALAAGLCAYKDTFDVYPDDQEKLYGQGVRKRSDVDPYDDEFGPLRYRLLTRRESVDTQAGRLWVDADEGLLYALGQDHTDDRAAEHTDDGVAGDLVLWPPVKSLARRQGKID
ncbi:MAG: hypothetical protein ACYS0G_05585 [Planctomycetota bacterium]|jgi:hypothetical protein